VISTSTRWVAAPTASASLAWRAAPSAVSWGRPGAVGGAAGDQAVGLEAEQEPGDLGAIEPQLWLAGEVVVQFGGRGGGAA
jgi:hypothetical protein